MTKLSLMSTVAASLLLSAGAASAQMQQKMPERAPPAQQSAPAEKIAPPINAGEHKGAETTGQNVKSLSPGQGESATTGSDVKGSDNADVKGESPRDAKGTDASREKAPDKKGRAESVDRNKATERVDSKAKDENAKASASQKASESVDKKTETSGQGAAAGSAKLSTEQRTKITTIIHKQKVERVSPSSLNISIRVGARIPARVHFHPLPVEVVDVYPEWRGYLFILVGDQIVIISPDSHEIVAVLTA